MPRACCVLESITNREAGDHNAYSVVLPPVVLKTSGGDNVSHLPYISTSSHMKTAVRAWQLVCDFHFVCFSKRIGKLEFCSRQIIIVYYKGICLAEFDAVRCPDEGP